MIRLLHVLDSTADWEQRIGVSQLVDRLPEKEYSQTVAAIGSGVLESLGLEGTAVGRPLGMAALAGASLRRRCLKDGVDVVHAWGVDAAAAARAAIGPNEALAVTIFDPGIDERQVRLLRTVVGSGRTAVVCSAERVRRRLVEQGVPIDCTVLLRPGVDFACLGGNRRPEMRRKLGVTDENVLVLTAGPPSEHGGQFEAVWSVTMRSFVDERFRIAVPGVSVFQRRLVELAKKSGYEPVCLFTEDRFKFEELLCAADYFVLPAAGEVSTTSIAWAMAAGVPIIAAATYSTSEMLTDKLNATLFKAADSGTRTGALLCAIFDELDGMKKQAEVASGQVFEVMSLSRCVKQHMQLYGNLNSGSRPAEGIDDPAVVAG